MQVGVPTAAPSRQTTKQSSVPAAQECPCCIGSAKDSCCTADFVAQRQVLQLGRTAPEDYAAGADSTMKFHVSDLSGCVNLGLQTAGLMAIL